MRFVSSRPDWLRPVWAALLCSIFLLSAEYSPVSAFPQSKYEVDKNWIQLDNANFPPTINELNTKTIDHFYYVRGLFDTKMPLTDDMLREIDTHPDQTYHLKFKIWRNAVRCVKYFSVGQDSITNILDANWVLVEKHYTAKEFRDFTIWLSGQSGCETSVMAIKELTLSYNTYTNSSGHKVEEKVVENQYRSLPDFSAVSVAERTNWNIIFHDCAIPDACSFVVPKAILLTTEVKFSVLHSHKQLPLNVRVEGETNPRPVAVNVPLEILIAKQEVGQEKDIHVKIEAAENSTISVKIDATHATNYAYGLVVKPLGVAMLQQPTVHLLTHITKSLSVHLLKESQTAADKTCYSLDYFVEASSAVPVPKLFSLSVDVNGAIYPLFDFIPIAGAVENVKFCLHDFLYKPVLFGAKKIQLLLQSVGSNLDDRMDSPDFVLINVVNGDKDPVLAEINYLNKDSDKKWSAVMPAGTVPTAKAVAAIKTIKDKITRSQIQGVWLKNDPKLSHKPIKLELTIKNTIPEVITALGNLEIQAKICDEIMQCVRIKQQPIKPKSVGVLEYEYTFDSHPNKNSKHVKLVLNLEVPELTAAADLEIELISFGDPCGPYTECKTENNQICKADPKTTEPNDFSSPTSLGVCACKDEGYSGAKCDVANYCITDVTAKDSCKFDATKADEVKSKCRNNKENTEYECLCDDKDLTKIHSSTDITKCEQILPLADVNPPVDPAKEVTWTFQLTDYRPDQYDLCYKVALTDADKETDVKARISVTLNTQENNINRQLQMITGQPFFHYKGAAQLEMINFCLGSFVDLSKFNNEKASLVVKLNTDGDTDWDPNLVSFYGKPIVARKPNYNLFEVISSVPSNIVKVVPLATPVAGKQEVVFNPIAATVNIDAFTTTLYSEWILNDKSIIGADKINENKIKLDAGANVFVATQICRPRTGGADCGILTDTNKLATILGQLGNPEKFQVLFTVSTRAALPQIELDKVKLNLELSIWEPCFLHVDGKAGGCLNGGKCSPGDSSKSHQDASTFTCGSTCNAGYAGNLCQFPTAGVCTTARDQLCAAQGVGCIVDKNNGEFACDCLPGYQFNRDTSRCELMEAKFEERKCPGSTPDECFLNGIKKEPYSYLPRNFPLIDKAQSNSLYYTTQSESKLTINVNDTEKFFDSPANDVCVMLRYYVAPLARLTVRFEDQIDLLVVEGVQTIPVPGQVVSTGLSEETEVCLKSRLPIDKLKESPVFHLTIVSQTTSPDDAIAIELIHKTSEGLNARTDLAARSETALTYLSRETAELFPEPQKSTITGLNYQWTANFPAQMWTYRDLLRAIEFKGKKTGTVETAYLESAWIDRPIPSPLRSAPVFLDFQIHVPHDTGAEQLVVNVYLIDSNRKQIGSSLLSFTGADLKVAPPAPGSTSAPNASKDGHFAHQLSVPAIAHGQRYKVLFHIRYQDKILAEDTLFVLSDLSFGDPCVAIDKDTHLGDTRKCYTVDKLNVVVDPAVHCARTNTSTGAVDFQCDCKKDSGLSGKDCSVANYCELEHNIEVLDPKIEDALQAQLTKHVTPANGNKFCAVDPAAGKAVATCLEGKYGKHNFLCHCVKPLEQFDFYERICKPINPCILKPCSFDTQVCSPNPDGITTKCTCKSGFKNVNASDTSSACVSDENHQCDKKKLCGSEDPHMMCLPGINDRNRCVCAHGFRMSADSTTCQSEMCNFPALHKCPQDCVPQSSAPYYRCQCNEAYYDLHETKDAAGNVTGHECVLKATAPQVCKDCTGKHKVCRDNKCECIENFELQNSDCVPKSSHKLLACPNGNYKVDAASKEVICDCANSTGYFEDDPSRPGSCKLAKTICDQGEFGRNFCEARGAGCVVNPFDLNSFGCECNVGKLFPNGKRTATDQTLQSPINAKTKCIDICDLPYKRDQCAAKGAKCNPLKLWSFATTLDTNNPMEYCECVLGTYYDANGPNVCVQERRSLELALTFHWSHSLQDAYNDYKKDLINKHHSHLFETRPKATDYSAEYIDPITISKATLRALELNEAAVDNKKEEEIWSSEIRKFQLTQMASTLLHNFKIIDNEKGLILSQQDMQVVSIAEDPTNKNHYVLRLTVKSEKFVKDSEMSDENDDIMQETVVPTTAAPATTAAPITLQGYDLARFEIIPKSCDPLSDNTNCVIPYLVVPMVLATKPITPAVPAPCTWDDICKGMSDCKPQNGSMFECACNTEFFDVESTRNYATIDPLVVYKDDRCKSKSICAQKCPSGTDNHLCVDHDPEHNKAQNIWTKDYTCTCASGYGTDPKAAAPSIAKIPSCAPVCQLAGCTANAKCVPSSDGHSAACECHDGWHGLKCDQEKASITWWIVAVAVLGVATLAGVGAAIFFGTRKR